MKKNDASETFLDKLNNAKKKLDMKSKGVIKKDMKLEKVDPKIIETNDTAEEPLVLPPLKNETIKTNDKTIMKVKISLDKYNPE